ncbi:MAG: filamentous hemagglutinin N-terminal domain-containing protein, partial [Gammaproteobacteria bacterium]|nr:filamentous hemagglutinin N-terminal domain-containing protein [Gammaproteobacteria bacterium]
RNAIINWQSFSIGHGQTTNFIQPSSASAVMNRVISNNPSKIYGNLNSNGKVFLINQHGMMIGAGARINTAGFYGSTLNITNEDFLKGNLKFEGGGFGGIQNHGYIHAGPGGNVVLVAPDIENGGVIEVENGNVILAAGESIRITSLNDASIEFDVQSHDDNSIINLGDIIAKQGAARLFAGNLKHSGSINATGLVRNADGSISLVAQQDIEVTAGATLTADGETGGGILVQSHHGDVSFAGSASARGESGGGGNIEILGERVGLFGLAKVDASGQTGGGEVLIGGDYQGSGDVQTATQTQVGAQASIHADAIDSGDGGKVIVWADGFTLFEGEATATAGTNAGDGGFIEISGKGSLGYYGSVDASSENGSAGTVLFDPIDVVFQFGGPITLPVNPFLFTTPGTILGFDPTAITDITDTGTEVIIRADRDITINDPISTDEGGTSGLMTFRAGRSILINAPITTDNSDLQFYANDPGANPANRGTGEAQITMDFGATLDTFGPNQPASGGNIEFWMNTGTSGTSGDITVDNITANHVLIKHNGLTDGGDILQNSGSTIAASSLFIDHDGPANGTVGTSLVPLNLRVDNVGAHIHAATSAPNGIFIKARPDIATDVTVGETCYGNGVVGCDTFGSHIVKGLETLLGGDLELNVTGGGLNIVEPVIISDDVKIHANNLINVNADQLEQNVTVSGSNVSLTSFTDSVWVSGGNTTALSNASIVSTSGDVNVVAADLVFIGGSITESDAVVIANNGTTNLNFTNQDAACGNCPVLGVDPRTQTTTETGVFGANVFTNFATFWDAGGITGNWSEAANWTLDTRPSVSDNVYIGDFIVTVNGVFDMNELTQGGAGTINQSNNLTISGNANLFGNYQVGFGALDVGGSLTIGGNLDLVFGSITTGGDITVAGLTTWNPPDTGAIETFTLTGGPVGSLFFANGGFDLGSLLDLDDTLILDKNLVINGSSTWDGFFTAPGTITITGTGSIINNHLITVINDADIGVDVPVINIGEISKELGTAELQFTQPLNMTPGSNLYLANGRVVRHAVSPLFLNGAELGGGGNFIGDVISSGGIIDVEDDLGGTGTFTITGDLTLDPTSTVVFEIAGTQATGLFDVLAIDGDAILDGYMLGLWLNGYSGTDAAPYTLITTTGTLSGASTFATELFPIGATASTSNYITGVGGSYEVTLNTAGNTINFWTNPLGGDWNTPADWSAGLPQATHYAVLAQDDERLVGVFDAQTVAGVEAQNPLDINGVSLTLNGDSFILDATLNNNGTLLANGNALLVGLTLNEGNLDGTSNFIVHPIGSFEIFGPTVGNSLLTNLDNFGRITGSGGLTIDPAATLINLGRIQPGGDGDIGTLTFGGDFSNSASGTIDIDIASTGIAGTNYDQLVVTGNADLQGFMALQPLGSYVAANNDTFTPIRYATSTSNSLLFFPTGSETVNPDYTAPDLDLLLVVPISWDDEGGDNDWFNGLNWSGNLVPTLGDDVSIGAFNVTISGAAADANTLTLAGSGMLTLQNNSLEIDSDSTLTGLLTINGGTLIIDDMTLTLNGGLNWNAASSISGFGGVGPGVLVNGAGSTITASGGTTTFDDVTLNNNGIFINAQVLNNDFRMENGTVINNVGTFEIQNGVSVFTTTTATFNNNTGTFISHGNTDVTLGISFVNNAGTVDIQGGILSLNGGVTPLTLDVGSVLTGVGTFNGNVTNNGGTVQPGGVATVDTLSITGNFTNSLGTVVIDIANAVTTAGVDYDQLAVTGTADFGGSLQLNVIGTYGVANNDTLDPISYATYGGTPFGTIVQIGGETITPDYTAPDLTLTFAGPVSWVGVGGGGNGIDWTDGLNWSGGLVPLIGDDVTIDVFNVTIAGAANASTLTLAVGGALNLTTDGVLTIASAASINGTLNLGADAILQGAGAITVNGAFNWNSTSGPAIRGAGLLTTTGLTTITGVSTSFTRNWTNDGVIDWDSGVFQIQTGATFTNNASFNVNIAGSITSVNAGTETFANAATGIMNLNANAAISPDAFTNAGNINLIGAGRILTFSGAGTDTGTWNLDVGTVRVTAGTYNLNSTFNLTANTGAVFEISGGVVNFNVASLSLPASLDLNLITTGQIAGSGNITVNGAFNWNTDNAPVSLVGSGLLTTMGLTTITCINANSIAMDWANFGLVDWNAGGFQLQTGNGFTNNGTFNANATGSITSVNAGTETFTNAAAGTMNINTDTSIVPDLFLQNGIFNLSGGDVTAAPIDNNGTINGTGVITGDIVNQSTVQPGGPGTVGTLTINGNFTNSTGGILVIDILDNVQAAGTGYDLLDVLGVADLNDTLVLNSVGGYTVANNDSFTPITYGTDGGNVFTTIVGIGGEIVTPTYNANDFNILLTFGGLFTWTGAGVDDFWNNPANWDQGVPGIGNDAAIPNGSGFNVTVAAAADASTLALGADATLTLTGGTLTLANDSTLNGAVTLAGGALELTGVDLTLNGNLAWFASATIQSDGSGVLNLTSTASLSGSAIYTLSNVTVNNSGSFSLTAGIATGFRLEDSTIFNNSGTFTINNDSDIFDASGSPGTFNNTGTIRKAGGAGTSTIGSGIIYNHTAANIDILSGTLVLGAGAVTLDSGSMLTGTGTLGNTLNNIGGLVDPGGQSSIGTLTINGDYNQDATGNLVIEIASNGGGTPVAGVDNDFLMVTGNTSVAGTLTLLDILGYTVTDGDTFNVMNVAGTPSGAFGTIVSIGGAIATPTYASNDLFIDLSFAGLFTWTGAGGDDFWNNPLNWNQGVPGIGNDASIPNSSGFSVDIASAADASTLTLGADATLNFIGGTLTLANDSTLDGSVNLVTGGFDLSGSTLTLNNGLNWSNTSSIANGTLILPAGGPLVISGGAANTLDNVTVNTNSNTTYSAGNLTLVNGSAVNTNAVFDFAGDVDISGTASNFNASNSSTIVKSAGAGTSLIAVGITSSVNGSVDVQTGNLNLNLALLDLDAGDVFSGNGNYIGNVTNNGGMVRPGAAGSVGTLTVSGDFVSNSGALEIDISSAVLFDQLVVTNGTFGGGSIDINLLSYIPATTDLQPVILCAVSCAGAGFASINAPPGIVYGQIVNATNLTLDVLSVTFAWDGGGDGLNWTDPLNWSWDGLPGPATDVVIPVVNVAFNGTEAVNSLTLNSGAQLAINGGSLAIGANNLGIAAGATLTNNGGTLTNAGVASIGGSYTQNSGSAIFTGNVITTGTFAVGGGNVIFNGGATFGGSFGVSGLATTVDFNTVGANFNGPFNMIGGTLTLNAVGTLFGTNNSWSGGTITGGASVELGAVLDGSTLAISGSADKILAAITLNMNQNDIFMSGSGNLVLAGVAIIDNTNGTSFNHSGNGGLTGTGTFDNTNGQFNKLAGNAFIAPTVNFINTGTSLVNVAGGSLTFVAGGADAGNYNVGGNGTLAFTNGRTLAAGSTLNLAGNLVVGNGTVPTTLTLPGTLNNSGNIQLNNATLDLANLGGNLLQLNNGAILSGVGGVTGNVVNTSGVVVAGGAANIGNLTISGNYTQGAGSALVVEVFNNGFSTQSDQLVANSTNLNGGALVIGFKTNSLGLVTSNFTPLVSPSVNGNFTRVFDAGGNILFINFNAGVFTVLGTTPKIPDAVIDDLISFAKNSEKFTEKIANNKSEAEQIMNELLKDEEQGQGSLICN